jgi:hypothetical protein
MTTMEVFKKMSQIRYRIFTERGSSRAPAPFNQKPSQDSEHDSTTRSNVDLTDRKPAGERDEIASSAVLGYN